MKKFAIIFSGQGLYYPNILNKLIKKYKIFKKTFYEVSEFLKYDLLKEIFIKKKYNLQYQLNIQYLILTSSVAMFRMWLQQSSNMLPNIMAGHSIGQYSALICNNSIKFFDVLKIIKIRNNIIKEKTKNQNFLTYVILGLSLKIIKKICKYVSNKKEKAYISCINSEDQIVITGHYNVILKANIICKKYGAIHTIKLPIKISMHCILMKKISKIFSSSLKKIKISTGICPIIDNVDVSYINSPKDIYVALLKQFYRPVQWNKTIKKIIKNKINFCIEISLNNILKNLNTHKKKLTIFSINSVKNLFFTINKIQNEEKKK